MGRDKGGGDMTYIIEKMKTLKDFIDRDSFDVNVIMPDKLRQSAIEDIKILQTSEYDQDVYDYMIEYIKDKFNLTDEDLK